MNKLANNQKKYLFETSWEVCNKVGGIHTVLVTKTNTILPKYKNRLILIGPDIHGGDNKEFQEDLTLYVGLKKKLIKDGIKIRIGRWKIVGNPLVILIDMTSCFAKKDAILGKLWEDYKLDSLNGGWDYIEPTIFGYIAGIVIEKFASEYIPFRENVVAHFHEWMTGAGILYLKKNAPFIATVFTSHATVLGRSIAGNNNPLYENLENYDSQKVASRYNITSKHSLESISAQQAHCFTTVSEITQKECEKFLDKKPDLITPNGFSLSLVPQKKDFENRRKNARKKIISIVSSLTGESFDENVKIVMTSGRYEYLNKGIDTLLDALKNIEESDYNKKIIALFCIPLFNVWARTDLAQNMKNGKIEQLSEPILTHYFHNDGNDPILHNINNSTLLSSKKIKSVFVPCYLDGNDGIFNLHYYDVLIGADLTVFASRYEPWGYTPQESIAFSAPTITTDLAGYGTWKKREMESNKATVVVDRFQKDNKIVANDVAENIKMFLSLSKGEKNKITNDAKKLSKASFWENFIKYYYTAYDIALSKTNNSVRKIDIFKEIHVIEKTTNVNWNLINVKSIIPKEFEKLHILAQNTWINWNQNATNLFKYINKDFVVKFDSNPVKLLNSMDTDNYQKLSEDKVFWKMLDDVFQEFKTYMEKPFISKSKIAYFSMEFGITNYIRLYSGGLGILAGDYLKEASDRGVDIVAIGLLYKHGYFNQRIEMNDRQNALSDIQNFNDLPIKKVIIENKDLIVTAKLPGRNVLANVWLLEVGKVKLYLLDTDLSQNSDEDRGLTSNLYGGDNEHRLKQEILLGFGGIKVLKKLKINPDIYHCNEGHAAFINLKRICDLVKNVHLTFEEAIEYVKSSSLFTTHTPVAAGHDSFDDSLMRRYFRYMPSVLNISWEKFTSTGKFYTNCGNENFSMSALAANTSSEINGVSELHCEVSKDIFEPLYPGYFKEESHIGYVTNGVHFSTWACTDIQNLLRDELGSKLFNDQSNPKIWSKIYDIKDEALWNIRLKQKNRLIDYIKQRYFKNWKQRLTSPDTLLKVINKINPKALTIGFARRFATYKRAGLLFTDRDRLAKIVNNPNYPVQFIFAGKAHPKDIEGQDIIARIIKYSKQKEFIGKIIFLENYNIELAKKLVSGVDIWLNTPTRPLEASGTSGQKALLNGVINFSVLDGWWCEGYIKGAGFAIAQERSYSDQHLQNMFDATRIYNILEKDIIPTFFNRNESEIPTEWIKIIKNSLAQIAPKFTTTRMIDDYINKFYNKLTKNHALFKANNYNRCLELTLWKNRVLSVWDKIKIVFCNEYEKEVGNFHLGNTIKPKIVLKIDELDEQDFGVEFVIKSEKNSESKIIKVQQMRLEKREDNQFSFQTEVKLDRSGPFGAAIRLYPKHPYLTYRQSFNYVKWF